MTYLEAIILGLVQGIAEFLPISSSGHLKLFEKLLGLPNVETDYILFDVLLHFGTLVAVLIVYRKVIADLLREALTMVHLRTPRPGETPDLPKRRMIALLIASLLPLFLILPIKDRMEKLGGSYLFIGLMLITTGLVLYLCDHFAKGKKTEREMTIWDALVQSKNTVAAQIIDKLTPSVSFEYLKLTWLISTAPERWVTTSLPSVVSGSVSKKGVAISRMGLILAEAKAALSDREDNEPIIAP